MPNSDTLTVLASFIGRIGSEDRFFIAGEIIRPTDPAVKKWPHKFGPARFIHDRVEQATAAPGEKRQVSIRGRVKAAAKRQAKAAPKPEPTPEPTGTPVTSASFAPTDDDKEG